MEGETQLSQAVLFITTCAPLHYHTHDTYKVGGGRGRENEVWRVYRGQTFLIVLSELRKSKQHTDHFIPFAGENRLLVT